MSELAKPGDPLILSDQVITAEDDEGEITEMSLADYQAKRLAISFLKFTPTKERTLEDLTTEDAKDYVACLSVVSLRLLGLSFQEIAEVFGVTLKDVMQIVQKEKTQSAFELIFQSLINVSAENLQGRIAAYGNNALSVIAKLMNDDETQDMVRFKAAQDILDRSGTNDRTFFGQNSASDSGDDNLNISFFTADDDEKPQVSVSIKKGK
jgi:hypothetical protein